MQSIEIIRKLLKGLSDVYELISPVHNVFSANNQQRSRSGLPNELNSVGQRDAHQFGLLRQIRILIGSEITRQDSHQSVVQC